MSIPNTGVGGPAGAAVSPTSGIGAFVPPQYSVPIAIGSMLGGQVLGSKSGGSGPQKAGYSNGQWTFGNNPVSPSQMTAYGNAMRQGPAGQGTMWDVNNSRTIMNGMQGNTTNLAAPSYTPGINHAPMDTQNFNNIAGIRINEYANEHGIANPFATPKPPVLGGSIARPSAPAQQPTAPQQPVTSNSGNMGTPQVTQGGPNASAEIQAPTFAPAVPLQPQQNRYFTSALRQANLPPVGAAPRAGA